MGKILSLWLLFDDSTSKNSVFSSKLQTIHVVHRLRILQNRNV